MHKDYLSNNDISQVMELEDRLSNFWFKLYGYFGFDLTPIILKDLAQQLDCEKSTCFRHIKDLAQKNFLQKYNNPQLGNNRFRIQLKLPDKKINQFLVTSEFWLTGIFLKEKTQSYNGKIITDYLIKDLKTEKGELLCKNYWIEDKYVTQISFNTCLIKAFLMKNKLGVQLKFIETSLPKEILDIREYWNKKQTHTISLSDQNTTRVFQKLLQNQLLKKVKA